MMRTSLCLALIGFLVWMAPTAVHSDYIKGASYFAQGKYELAIKEYEEELRADPAYVQGYYVVGLCYARLKNYDPAIESLKKAQALDRRDFQIALALAQAYFDAQKYTDLNAALNTATVNARAPADLEKLKFLRAAALFNQQDYAKALPELESAVKSDPKNASLQAQLGIADFHLQKYDDAVAALTVASSLNPDDAQAAVFLGEAYFAKAMGQPPRERQKTLTSALHVADKWVEKQPQNFDALALAGRAALALKNYPRAIATLKQAVALQPESAPAQFNLGQAYAFSGQFAEAENALTQASQSLTQEPALFSILGFVLEKEDKPDAALAAYEKANSLSPSPALQSSIDRVKQKQKQNNPDR